MEYYLNPGNKSDLIDKVKWILNNPKECDQIDIKRK